jgi:hypothetical protein
MAQAGSHHARRIERAGRFNAAQQKTGCRKDIFTSDWPRAVTFCARQQGKQDVTGLPALGAVITTRRNI